MTARLLMKVGVKTVEDFLRIGASDAYVLIKQKGFHVGSHLFWTLYAASKNKFVETLTKKEKIDGLREVNSKLLKANFRDITMP